MTTCAHTNQAWRPTNTGFEEKFCLDCNAPMLWTADEVLEINKWVDKYAEVMGL